MSNIGKRFANPSVWEQPYFTELNTNQRLFWIYINNRCDLSGVYQLHYPVDSAFLGFTINEEFIKSFINAINSDEDRVQHLEGRRLWLLNFVRYQQTGKNRNCLSARSGPHISIVGKLKENNLFNKAVKNDPELYKEYIPETLPDEKPSSSDPSNDNKGKTTLKEGYRKGYSNSSSNSSSNGDSPGSSNGKSKEKDENKDIENLGDTPEAFDNDIFGKPSLQLEDEAPF